MTKPEPNITPALPQHPPTGFADGIRFALATLRHLPTQHGDLHLNADICNLLEHAADEAQSRQNACIPGSHMPTVDELTQLPPHPGKPQTHTADCGLPGCGYRASGLSDAEAQANLSRHLDDAHGPETETLTEAGQDTYRLCLSAAQSARAWFDRSNEIPDFRRRQRAMRLADESRRWSERAAELIERAWRVASNDRHIPTAGDA